MLPYKERSIVLLNGVFQEGALTRLNEYGKDTPVFIMEGRPHLDAAKFSSLSLLKMDIVPTLITDNMAGFLFYKNLVKEAWVAYQYSDETGALCDIGGLILCVLGKKHGIPIYMFPGEIKARYVAEPVDMLNFQGREIAPSGVKGYAPLVEWVPTEYITETYPHGR